MNLAIYQKAFSFTHNDLHTNNIMYVETNKKHLIYKFGNRHYKIPTFGRLFKIIDFGRAIYKFRGHIICSDSYHPKGDAAGQYNFGPYYNENKPRLEPNFGFDLCRLGCALYDSIINDDVVDVNNERNLEPIKAIIVEWCIDDKGKNILYKSTGEERYPGFKLYKMIARNANKHTPENVMKKPFFEKYLISRKSINRYANIINIDAIPSYTD